VAVLQREQKEAALKILMIEDNPEDRALYKRLLEKSGLQFEIHEAESASEGLRLACEKNPDCIVLDYQLPDADGIGFIKTYQEKCPEQRAAIVMATGQGSEKIAVEALKTGALDYISKASISDGFFVQNILNATERSQLKNQVREYQAELERSNQALSNFTHTVSHDLKAPLRRIVSYCGLLKEDANHELGEQATQYVDRLLVNSQRLHKLVEDLLSYSQVMHSKEAKQNTDIKKLIDDLREDLGALIQEHKVEIIMENLTSLPVYPLGMRQMFQNLLINSIKYRGAKPPAIKIKYDDKGSYGVFSVQDNGIGISPEYHKKIFEEFERLHTQDQIEGSGLGLSICKKISELHQGKIWVESEPGQGSTFFFTIQKT
jgi:signal transduction histidine kinase